MREKETKALQKTTEDFISGALTSVIEGFTGIASSERKELVISIGTILQHARNGRFLEKLKHEWANYRSKGKIEDTYQYTEQHYACLQELFDSLDSDLPDDKRFETMKQVFLVASTEEQSTRNDPLPLEFMKSARLLSGAEVLILNAAYAIAKANQNPQDNQILQLESWRQSIADRSKLLHPELVELYENELEQKNLIYETTPDEDYAFTGRYHRLTRYGFALCEFISHYEMLERDEQSTKNN